MDASPINENKWISIVKYGCQWINEKVDKYCNVCVISIVDKYGCQCNKWK